MVRHLKKMGEIIFESYSKCKCKYPFSICLMLQSNRVMCSPCLYETSTQTVHSHSIHRFESGTFLTDLCSRAVTQYCHFLAMGNPMEVQLPVKLNEATE